MTGSDRVLAVGSPLLDLLLQVPEGFIASSVGEKGGTVQIPKAQIDLLVKKSGCSHTVIPGGAAGNTCRNLALLGGHVAMLGMLGDDANGQAYVAALKASGASTEGIFVHPTLPTGVCASFVTSDGERTMRSDLAASLAIKPEDFKNFAFKDFNWIYMEGYMLLSPELTSGLIAKAKESNCQMALDLSSFELARKFHDLMIEILSTHINLVFANRDEAQALLGELPDEQLVLKLASLGPIAVLKLGENGALIATKTGELWHAPVKQKIKALDTTGAGDAFAAGFFWGLAQNLELIQCGHRGNAVAAEVIQVQGADLPVLAAIQLKKQFN